MVVGEGRVTSVQSVGLVDFESSQVTDHLALHKMEQRGSVDFWAPELTAYPVDEVRLPSSLSLLG